MMRACTRHNLVDRPAPPQALIPVKAVEAFLQCFGAAEKSMNRKNSKREIERFIIRQPPIGEKMSMIAKVLG